MNLTSILTLSPEGNLIYTTNKNTCQKCEDKDMKRTRDDRKESVKYQQIKSSSHRSGLLGTPHWECLRV